MSRVCSVKASMGWCFYVFLWDLPPDPSSAHTPSIHLWWGRGATGRDITQKQRSLLLVNHVKPLENPGGTWNKGTQVALAYCHDFGLAT